MGWGMVRQSVIELTDAAKGNEEQIKDLRYLALRVPGVRECGAVRVRQLGPYGIADMQIFVTNPAISVREALDIQERVRNEVSQHMPQLREVIVELGKMPPSGQT
jgi:divalent metal cation (Fe/Co/Zn/Cd) transporter